MGTTGQVTPLLCASFPRQHYIDRVSPLFSPLAGLHACLPPSLLHHCSSANACVSDSLRLVDGWPAVRFSASVPDSSRYLRLFPIVPEAYFEILVTRLPSQVPATGWPPCLPSSASPSLACLLDPPSPSPLPVFPRRAHSHDLRVGANWWRLLS